MEKVVAEYITDSLVSGYYCVHGITRDLQNGGLFIVLDLDNVHLIAISNKPVMAMFETVVLHAICANCTRD